jgi:hypothetical protein
MMNVARQRPRKNSTTSDTQIKAIKTVCPKLLILFWINFAWSSITSILMSGGRSRFNFGSSFCTAFEMATVLLPDCFCITICPPCVPLSNSSWVIFLMVSFTSATSDRNTVFPPKRLTTSFLI